MDKRIIEETPSSEVLNDDWFIKDSPTGGTSKILGSNLKEIISGDVEDAIDKILDSIAPEWSPITKYGFDSYVIHEGELWRCFKDTGSTVGEFKTSEWIKAVTSGYITHVINKIADRFVASNPPFMIYRYSVGDMVFYSEPYHDEQLYVCNTDLPQGESTFNPEHWDVVYTVAGLSKYLMDKIAEAGQVDDVKVDGVSVVDENKVAQITTPDADGISYDNTTSGLEADDVQEAIDEVVTDIESVETALETKADVDGFYDELYAGNLLSDNTETDNSPYTYRPSPSGKSYVDLSVVGGTVAWNQLVQFTQSQLPSNANGITYSYTDGTSFKISGTATAQEQRSGWFGLSENIGFEDNINHKVIICTKIISGTSSNTILWGYNNVLRNWGESNIFIVSDTAQRRFYYRIPDGTVCNDLILTMTAIDLTQMFGSTIADYIYSLEQATAGSGIAWLKSYGFLTKDYYAYDSGSLQSVNVSSRKVVGFNQWDEEWEVGGLNPLNGDTTSENDRIRSKNFSPCKPNMTMFYYIPSGKGNLQIVFYDINKNYLGYYNFTTEHTFTTPNGCCFFKFNTGGSYGTTYNNDICINISDASKNGTYEPYTKHTYPLDSSLTLRGIPKLDSNNQLYFDGDVYESDGSVKRKYGIVNLGDLTWSSGTIGQATVWYTTLSDAKKPTNSSPFNGYGYPYDIIRYNGISTANTIAIRDNGVMYVNNGSTTTEPTGQYIYELATPTTESANAYENPQLVGSTEEFIDTRDVPIPVGGERKYYTDLKAKLEELAKIPDVPSTNGTYTLKATRSASGVTYSWVSG